MSDHTSFAFFVNNKLYKTSWPVVRYYVGVVTSPGKLVKFPPTVSRMRCVSAFCGRISSTILPYVTVLHAITFSLGIKNMEFVPDGILVTTRCASR